MSIYVDIRRMADWHLKELRAALEKRGWRIEAELPGDNYAISGSWRMKRAGDTRHLIVDFEGMDDLRVLPLSESYACDARGTSHSLYFLRRGVRGSKTRERWKSELAAFVAAVSNTDDTLANTLGSKLEVQFDDPQHGWMAMSIRSDSDVTLTMSSVAYDTLNELIEGLHALITGDSYRTIRVFEEPTVCELRFECEGTAIRLNVLRPSSRGDGEPLLETDGNFSEICLPFWRALRNLQSRFSAEEFALRWGRSFPLSGMQKLSTELRRQPR
jgi:hypothetical protein